MNLNINDFMGYAQTGEVPTVYSRQQAAKKTVSVASRPRPAIATMTAPVVKTVAPVPVAKVVPSAPILSPIVIAPSQPVKPALELVNYSDRSFAVFGQTKTIKDQLEALGGKFNNWLKRDGIATPGYIFSISRIDNVRKALNL